MPASARVTRASCSCAIHPISIPHLLPSVPERSWTAKEWTRIELGHRSEDMDGKWDIFVEDETLFAHRSWTGFGIYEATFARVDGGGRQIIHAVAERDPERYRSTDDKVDRVFLELLITRYLLDQPAPELSAEFQALARAAWGGPAAPDLDAQGM